MIVTHSNTNYKGRLVIEGTEVEFYVLDTVINEVIDKLTKDATYLKIASSIRNELLSLIDDLSTYRSTDGFYEFLKWEEDYKG